MPGAKPTDVLPDQVGCASAKIRSRPMGAYGPGSGQRTAARVRDRLADVRAGE